MNILSADIVRAALSMLKPRPCVEMYPGDWLRDPISGCSLAANGFWWRATMAMHDAKPYGHMVANNGQSLTERQIVQRCGCKSVAELRKVVAEIEACGIPGRTGDADYAKILDADPIVLRGIPWKMDLSPLAIEQSGVMYSRRMLRDRILSLVRFLVSPRGQDLMGCLKEPLKESLNPQNSTFDRVRAGDQKEDEEEDEEDSLSVETESSPRARKLSPQQEAVRRVQESAALVELSGVSAGQVVSWLRDYGDADWILAVIGDASSSLVGKDTAYLHAILKRRHREGWQPPSSRARLTIARPVREVEPDGAATWVAPPGAHSGIWGEILDALRPDVDPAEFETWLERTAFLGEQGDVIEIAVPSARCVDEIRERFGSKIRAILNKNSTKKRQVSFVVGRGSMAGVA